MLILPMLILPMLILLGATPPELSPPRPLPHVLTRQISPAVPTATDPVVVTITATHSGCTASAAGFVRNGNVFNLRVGLGICIDPLPAPEPLHYNLGVLAPGVYTVRVVEIDGVPFDVFSFAVADAHVPALDPRGIGILAIAIAAAALLALGRPMP